MAVIKFTGMSFAYVVIEVCACSLREMHAPLVLFYGDSDVHSAHRVREKIAGIHFTTGGPLQFGWKVQHNK